MSIQEQREEALRAYQAIEKPARKAYDAIEAPAWKAYQAKLKEIEVESGIIVDGRTYVLKEKD